MFYDYMIYIVFDFMMAVIAGMVINRAELLSVALNMVKLNIVMNVKVIHVKNIGILINMILL